MGELGTKEVFIITIHTVDPHGKKGKYYHEENSLVDATRCILTYKPTRNHETIEFKISKELRLSGLI